MKNRILFILFTLAIGACRLLPTDVPVAEITPTAVAPVVPEQPTQSPSIATSTPSSTIPTATQIEPPPEGSSCIHRMSFIGDVTIPNGSQLDPGSSFVKIWRIRNDGTCAWESGATWFFAMGSQMGGPSEVNVPVTMPGETADIAVNLIAPPTPGDYSAIWILRLADGHILDNCCYIRIIVSLPTPGPTTPPQPTPLPTSPSQPTPLPTLPPQPTPLPTSPPQPTATPPQSMINWRGEYWSNPNLSGSPALVRDDSSISFNWGLNSPATNLPDDRFSARWTRIVNFVEGLYSFETTVDDGMRLYIDEELVIDSWQEGERRELSEDYWLTPGTHMLRVDYFEISGNARMRLRWEKESRYSDWRAEYWSNRNLTGSPNLLRNEQEINFNWELDAPWSGFPADNFSARWSRFFTFDDGRYRFFASADDGIRVYVDDLLIINQWHESSGDRVYQAERTLSGTHEVIVTYYELHLGARVKFWIDRVGNSSLIE